MSMAGPDTKMCTSVASLINSEDEHYEKDSVEVCILILNFNCICHYNPPCIIPMTTPVPNFAIQSGEKIKAPELYLEPCIDSIATSKDSYTYQY